jgi:adenine-specific DNA-methyltransferase
MANVLDGLLGRIEDEALRAEIAAEVAQLRSSKEFGLVFERHLPETVALHTHPVARGTRVRLKSDPDRGLFRVLRVFDDIAQVVAEDGVRDELAVGDLVVVRTFGETIYPGFRTVGSVENGDDRPFHVVVNGENHHALEALSFALEGTIDCIYIDPPYNTGARDWKYNNNYVDTKDAFRHSKWLSFIEKRLRLAKRMLNPDDSVLLVTIDDNELFTLGLLLDQLFPTCERQTVSITISPRGKSRDRRLSQVDEYLLVVYLGAAGICDLSGGGADTEVRWRYLRRNDIESARGTAKGGPNQFYPIYVDEQTERIVRIGEPLRTDQGLEEAPAVEGAVAVFPIRDDDKHMNWGLTGPSLQRALDQGYVRVTRTAASRGGQPFTIAYLTGPNIKKVGKGEFRVTGTRPDGSKIVVIPGGKESRPTTAWRDTRYDAGAYGTGLIGSFLPGRKFPFPKSLYAVEDTLRLFVKDKPDAVILDFFGGSGTTTHAAMRLNRQDGGSRRTVLVTNNEVSETEAAALAARGVHHGDPEWESQGIFHHITMPRLLAAVTGLTPTGTPAQGEYKFVDEGPFADGFDENIRFVELHYLDRNAVARGAAFEAVAPLLWLRAGAAGRMIEQVQRPFAVPNDALYGVLFDIHAWQPFVEAVEGRNDLAHVFIVTDSLAQYQQVVAELPPSLEASMLYEDYLRNFEFVLGGAR